MAVPLWLIPHLFLCLFFLSVSSKSSIPPKLIFPLLLLHLLLLSLAPSARFAVRFRRPFRWQSRGQGHFIATDHEVQPPSSALPLPRFSAYSSRFRRAHANAYQRPLRPRSMPPRPTTLPFAAFFKRVIEELTSTNANSRGFLLVIVERIAILACYCYT